MCSWNPTSSATAPSSARVSRASSSNELGAAQRCTGRGVGAQRHRLQRWDRRVRDGRAVAASVAELEPAVVGSMRASRTSCGSRPWRGSARWGGAERGSGVVGHSAGISWLARAAAAAPPNVARRLAGRELEPDAISYSMGISAFEKGVGSGSGHWRCSARRWARSWSLTPSATARGPALKFADISNDLVTS